MKETVQTDRQNELDNCDFVKTILMLLVVLDHSMAFWTGEWFTKNPVMVARGLSTLSSWLNSVHIYGFALVSGYVFYYSRCEAGKYETYRFLLESKAKRLLLPYVVVSIMWAIPANYVFLDYDFSQVIRCFLLAEGPAQLWFLVMLFVLFSVFWPLTEFLKTCDLPGAAVILGAFCVGCVGGKFLPNIFQIWSALTYLPVFWLGFKFRQYGTSMVRKVPVLILFLASVLLFAVTESVAASDEFTMKIIKLGSRFALHIVGPVMSFVQQIIYVSIYLLNGRINPYLHAMVNFFVSIIISLLIASIWLAVKTRVCISKERKQ